MATTLSRNSVLIRLNDEKWSHILEEHGELAGFKEKVLEVVADPERILAGKANEPLAVREVKPGKWLLVVYKEQENDGFIITAFLTRRVAALNRRQQIWP